MQDKNKIVMAKYPKPILTECCGAPFASPGWPDSDICSDCKEHAGPYDEDETEDSKPLPITFPSKEYKQLLEEATDRMIETALKEIEAEADKKAIEEKKNEAK
jgi:hypothetical protein